MLDSRTSGPQLGGLEVIRPLGSSPWSPWLVKGDDQSWLVARPGRRRGDLPDHPALLPMQGAVVDAAGQSWVLVPYVSGFGLDRWIDRTGAMPVLEASACLAPIADAVACLHRSGFRHGDLVASRVLLRRGRSAVLDASCAAALGPGDAEVDVAALATLLKQLLGGLAPIPSWCAEVVRGTLDAEALARQLMKAGAAEHRRPRRGRRIAGGALVLVSSGAVVVAASMVGVAWAERGPAPSFLSQPAREESSSPSFGAPASSQITPRISSEQAENSAGPVWARVIRGLDDIRSQMLATGDAGLLTQIVHMGSAAERREASVLRSLQRRDLVAVGWHPQVQSVRPVHAATGRALLEVVDTLPGYWLQSRDAVQRHRVKGRDARRWTIDLVWTARGWVMSSVERARLQD